MFSFYSFAFSGLTGDQLLNPEDQASHLQNEPQLISTFNILLVVHPVELDNIGVVRESFEDVVLGLNFLIDVLKNKGSLIYKNISIMCIYIYI